MNGGGSVIRTGDGAGPGGVSSTFRRTSRSFELVTDGAAKDVDALCICLQLLDELTVQQRAAVLAYLNNASWAKS